MGSKSCLAGMEVPIIGSDAIKWFQVSVPSTSVFPSSSTSLSASSTLTKDLGSCSVIGSPPAYIFWKISRNQPNLVEIVGLEGSGEFPKYGLQICFPEALFPFILICKDETQSGAMYPYMLYAVTVSGVAYVVRLRSIHNYASCSRFSSNEVLEYNLQHNPAHADITAVAASLGCVAVGRMDGSVSCIRLGLLEPSSPGFVFELRDDVGLGRLWGIMSRTRTSSTIQDLVMSELLQKKLLFVIHSDGIFKVWDLTSHSKIFSYSTGLTFIKLWVGEPNHERSLIPLAMLHEDSSGVDTKMVSVYGLRYSIGDKIMFTMEPSILSIPVKNEELIDVKLTSDSVWILKDEGVVMQELFVTSGMAHCYSLQEAFVAEHLFQSSENSSDDILWLAHTVFPYPKEQIASVVSSIFIRRLLLPGIYHNAVLRATLQEYNKLFTDSDFDSITADGLKSEILAAIEHEGVSGSPIQVLNAWKSFCTRYYYNWCKINATCGLFIDSFSGAVGLVRKNNFSLFRVLDGIELLIYGSFDEFDNTMGSWMDLSNDELERDILFEVLQCISNVSQQLGKAASAVFYESLRTQLSSEEVLSRFLKILEAGHDSSISALHVSELGTDIAWEKEALSHRNLRKFSMDLFLSLHSLYSRATSWNKVLDVIQKYLKFFVPQKIEQNLEFSAHFLLSAPITVQAASQVAKVMFESGIDVLMLLNYMVNRSGQIGMTHEDVSRIKLELVPMIQELLSEWHVIHFFVTTPTESPAMEDFSIQLSALQIDGNMGKRTFNEKLGKCDFTLASLLVLTPQSACGDQSHASFAQLTDPSNILSLVREFTSWVIWGRTGEESSVFFTHSVGLALIFLRHGQYDAIEYLLSFVDAYLRKEKIFESVQSEAGRWATLLHLLGCCLVAQAQRELRGVIREKKISEAICCFYRVASTKGAPDALKDLPPDAGWARLGFTSYSSASSWKLHYYQWTMQIFEQYNMNEAACRFAITALEQVDEAIELKDGTYESNSNDDESATVIKGRLWANVFKFSLDLSSYSDAYCAIISNPDEESKNTCLRRFIFVLCERGALKILCDGQLPFVGLGEKVEQELAWKAERSDILVKPNAFKLLYAFEMHRHNWRKAASYIYQHSFQLKIEVEMKDNQHRAFALQERLTGISAAINALQLVHPTCAWIDTTKVDSTTTKELYPRKRARMVKEPALDDVDGFKKLHHCVDIEKLENEYILTSAEYLLSLASIRWTSTGFDKASSDLVDLLVESNLYDMAFTVVLRFWKHSGLKRELERVFTAMALKCCPSGIASSLKDNRMQNFLLTSSQKNGGLIDVGPLAQQYVGNSQWETLEIYLEKYSRYHPRLPVVVAETLLASDSQIDLPLWLVQKFKGVRQESNFGMAGVESNPASLFRLYVDYGRYIEATNLLLESIESLSAMVPTDVIRRKRPSAVWFPYTIIERLWCQLQESIRLGRMVEQCEKLKTLLRGALVKHLNLVKVDSEDVISSVML